MNERELKIIGAVAGIGLLLFFLMNGVYDCGYSAGVAQRGDPNAMVYHHGPGPLPFLLLIAGVVAFILWRRRGGQQGGPNGGFTGGGPMGGGPRGPQPPRFFQEWHAQAHAGGPQMPQPAAPQTQGQGSEQAHEPVIPPPSPTPSTEVPSGGMPPVRPGPPSGPV